MIPYLYVTLALLLYPIIAWFIIKLTKNHLIRLIKVLWTFMVITLITIIFISEGIVTVYDHLNWFFITLIYLTLVISLRYTQTMVNSIYREVGKFLLIFIIGIGYISATLGFFFLMIVSDELSPVQNIQLSDGIIYKEFNIGTGPDPSIRLKKIIVYKKVKWLPVFAKEVRNKVFDEWHFPLQRRLAVTLSKDKKKILLKSHVEGYQVWNWNGSINLLCP